MSYINLFYIFIVLAIVMLVISIILFFALDIPNAIRIVNKKAPKKKGQRGQSKSMTGELSQKQPSSKTNASVPQKAEQKKKTTVLPTNNQVKQKKKTTVLQQNQPVLDSQPQPSKPLKKKTTVLKDSNNSQINKKIGNMNANNLNNDIFEVIETKSFITSEKTI